MKKLLIFTAVLIYSASLLAQSNKEDVAMIQAMFGKEKKELVKEYMTISEGQSTKFWALYDEYEDKRKALGRERISLIEAYAKDYEGLDAKKATTLMTKKFAWTQKFTQLQQTYFTKFSTIVGGLQASKLMQLEDYLENNIRLAIQDQIPFIGELDKKKLPSGSAQ
jgi:hypothetical protein